jgi:hypothetical protein
MWPSLPATCASETLRFWPDRSLRSRAVKAMFWIYLVLVWTGIVYFSVIGLTHH